MRAADLRLGFLREKSQTRPTFPFAGPLQLVQKEEDKKSGTLSCEREVVKYFGNADVALQDRVSTLMLRGETLATLRLVILF